MSIDGFDIERDGLSFVEYKDLTVNRVKSLYSKIYYDKRSFNDDKQEGILVGLNGLEKEGGKQRNKPVFNQNILGYLIANTSGFDQPDLNSGLLIGGRYDGNGFYLRKDNYLEKLPMFAASRYITYNRVWTERGRIMKSADGAAKFGKDVKSGVLCQYMLKVLLFTVLEMHNHLRSFTGSDGRFYRNELCLDVTNGATVASNDIKKLSTNKTEKELLKQWEITFENAQNTERYNKLLTYGIYQIYDELDTAHTDDTTNTLVYDYPELHGNLQTLKKMVKEYYNTEIVPTLFKYEFLK